MKRLALLLVFAVAGCGEKAPPAAPDTGSRDAATRFFTGLITAAPSESYDVLDAESQRRVSREQFNRLAQAYAKNLGFAPDHVHIRACEEQGESAIAHVTLNGRGGGHTQRFADGVALKRVDGRWRVALPKNFGIRAK